MAFVFNDMPAHSFVSLSSISTPIVVADIPPARVKIKKKRLPSSLLLLGNFDIT